MPPIFMTSTFVQEYPGEHKGYDYTRAGNPNFEDLERTLASLEGADFATVFSSGLGATSALLSTLEQGSEVVAVEGLYGGTYRLFTKVFAKFGINFHFVSPEQAKEAIRTIQPQLLFCESPTNPLLSITDLQELCSCAEQAGVTTLVDNTFATPYCQNPIELGADLVLHSTTKYIGGHSDVVGGAIITNDPNWKKDLDFARMAIGTNPSPFDTWMTLRGLKTLGLRMERHVSNAAALAAHFEQHSKVKKVYYPGLETHPGHEIAKKQMRHFGGIVSVEFDLDLEATKKMIASYKLFALAESLGGIESLVCHPASMTHASIPPAERKRIGLSDGLVRFSVGVEEIDDLVADIEQAFSRELVGVN